MKRVTVLAAVFAALIGVSAGPLALADEDMGMTGKKDMMGKGMMGKGMMGGMMMKGMMGKTVTATSDGGVVVLSGNQLFKYDKKLNLVNKAEIPVDMEAMQKDMAGMMKMCPMMGGDMGSDDASASVASEPEAEVDHAAHH